MWFSANKGLPLPLGRGVCETKSKNGRSRPRKPFIPRAFCAQWPSETMVRKGPDHGVGVDPETVGFPPIARHAVAIVYRIMLLDITLLSRFAHQRRAYCTSFALQEEVLNGGEPPTSTHLSEGIALQGSILAIVTRSLGNGVHKTVSAIDVRIDDLGSALNFPIGIFLFACLLWLQVAS